MLTGVTPLPILQSFRRVRIPFSYSGSWEGSLEGWSTSDMELRMGQARTGSYSLSTNFTVAGMKTAIFEIPANVAASQKISASVWHRAANPSPSIQRSFSYRIGAGSWITIGTVNDANDSYGQFSGTFDNAGNDAVSFRIQGDTIPSTGFFMFDDWAISGVPL